MTGIVIMGMTKTNMIATMSMIPGITMIMTGTMIAITIKTIITAIGLSKRHGQ